MNILAIKIAMIDFCAQLSALRVQRGYLCLCWIWLLLHAPLTQAGQQDRNLPTLGDHSSGIISLEQEYTLGQQFLRSIRAQAPLVTDPLLQEYLELLIYRLASFSMLQDRRLELVIINNKQINAFTAPGGVVGVNLGLLLYGKTESEVAAILAHEIAHLSQRHFARRTEAGRKTSIASIAGLLTGLVLVATSGGDAGLAAITATQGFSQHELLRYSRSREKEADLVGIYTLMDASLDPRAMAYMFERLNRLNRLNSRNIPEFLLTHPVTQDRIADSYAKTAHLPKEQFPTSLDFQLMRARVRVMTASSPHEISLTMQTQRKNSDPSIQTAGLYGLALAQIQSGPRDASMQNILALKQQHPEKLAFTLAEAELHLAAQRFADAIDLLQEALKVTPQNYPLTMAYAEALLKHGEPRNAAAKLKALTQLRPNDQNIWYLLAETYGLANNIVGVHEARAEYFILVGNFDQAIKQLQFAKPLARNNFQLTARIEQRLQEIFALKANSKS